MLREQLKERLSGDSVKRLSIHCDILELFGLIFDEDTRVARNAAWTITHKSDAEIAMLPQNELIDFALTTENVSLRRLTLSLIERQTIDEENMRVDLLDFCLAGMVSPEQPSGVQSLCMKLAYRISSPYPELIHEFFETLNLMPADQYTSGVKHLRKKLLNR